MSKWIIEKHKGILNTGRMLISDQLKEHIDVISGLEKNRHKKEYVKELVPALKSLQSALNYVVSDEKIVSLSVELIQKIIDLQMVSDNYVNELYQYANSYLKWKDSKNEFRFRMALVKNINFFISSLGSTHPRPTLHGLMNDYNRICNSSAFRRLQHKAQVFSLEKYDYARTRLTHTMEVSAVASGLCNICQLTLFNNEDYPQILRPLEFYFEKICACGALLHDIGNPPFGHFGEEAIKDYFKENWDKLSFNVFCKGSEKQRVQLNSFCGESAYTQMKKDFIYFDGNAQGFRLASKVQMYKPGHSLELNACVLGSMIKYPHGSTAVDPEKKKPVGKEKFGYFYSENRCIQELTALGVFQNGFRNPLVYLVEAADDICYTTSDFDDIVKKKILTYEIFHSELSEPTEFDSDSKFVEFRNNFFKYYDENKNICSDAFEMTIQRMSNDLRIELMKEVGEEFAKLLQYKNTSNQSEFFIDDEQFIYGELLDRIPSAAIIRWIRKNLFEKYVYTNQDVIATELAGHKIITRLLEDFVDAVLSLDFHIENNTYNFMTSKKFAKERRLFLMISTNFVDTFRRETEDLDPDSLEHIYYRLRLVVDYISGMTDSYATEIYKTLNGIDN